MRVTLPGVFSVMHVKLPGMLTVVWTHLHIEKCFCVLWHAYIFHRILHSFMRVTFGDFFSNSLCSVRHVILHGSPGTLYVQSSMSHFMVHLECFMISHAQHTSWLASHSLCSVRHIKLCLACKTLYIVMHIILSF